MRSVRRRRALGDARRQPNAAASSCAWRRITEDADELARLESRTTGKPLKQGRADVAAAARYFEFYEEVLERVGAAIAQLRVGPALADNDVGPLIRRNQLQRVWDYLSQA